MRTDGPTVSRKSSALHGTCREFIIWSRARVRLLVKSFQKWGDIPLNQRRNANGKTAPSPLNLGKREKAFTSDGGYRSRLPEDTLQQYAHLIGRSGIVEELECAYRDPCDLVHVYVARLRADVRGNHRRVWKGLRAPCVGKGMTEAQARVSALGEAVERYSAIFRGDEVRIKASYRELSSQAIHPNLCMNFSACQYRRREEWNQRETEFNWVPQRFDEERETEWTPVWSLTEERFKYAATASCYFGYPFCVEHDFCRPDSNGNAAGAKLEEAILQGFLEVVERDSVALWWYNRVRPPCVELASFGEPYFEALGELYRILGREMHVLDISTDFSIPAFAAVSSPRRDEGDLLLGFGAHLDPRIAIAHALTEMNQFLAEAIAGETLPFFVGEMFEYAFLAPEVSAAVKTRADYSPRHGGDLREDLKRCVELAWKRGLETLVLDQTRSDAGMRAVKVIVPGMRQWWARFAPGRLYDVPVELGWQPVALTEEQLNPCHLAF
jgi:YcaO-like protein with predicted kinase domain